MVRFDIDNNFISEKQDALAEVAFNYFCELEAEGETCGDRNQFVAGIF